MKRFKMFLFLMILGCAAPPKIITFKGSTIDTNIKTFSVDNFFIEAVQASYPAGMANDFTERFKLYIQRNSRLKLVLQPADLIFSGAIVGYTVSPAAPGGSDSQSALLQKLTITVRVNFVNNFKDSESFTKNFSFNMNFEASENLLDVRDQLITDIFNQIVIDIFNSSIANW